MMEASRVVILKERKILFIHRIKFGQEYYVLPGGAIEEGETPEEAAIREIKEETDFDIGLGSLLWEIDETYAGEVRKGYYFLAKGFKGELKLGYPEAGKQSESNKYIFEWIPIDKLSEFFIYPAQLKQRIAETFIY